MGVIARISRAGFYLHLPVIYRDYNSIYNPILSMYGIFIIINLFNYIYLHLPYSTIKKQPNVGRYTSPTDGMGTSSGAHLVEWE